MTKWIRCFYSKSLHLICFNLFCEQQRSAAQHTARIATPLQICDQQVHITERRHYWPSFERRKAVASMLFTVAVRWGGEASARRLTVRWPAEGAHESSSRLRSVNGRGKMSGRVKTVAQTNNHLSKSQPTTAKTQTQTQTRDLLQKRWRVCRYVDMSVCVHVFVWICKAIVNNYMSFACKTADETKCSHTHQHTQTKWQAELSKWKSFKQWFWLINQTG